MTRRYFGKIFCGYEVSLNPNTEPAYFYQPFVDAGIFVVTADPPLGESEHRFLKEVRGCVDKLFFVETTRSFQKSLSDKTDLTLSTIREASKRAIALKDRNETEVSATLSQLSTRLSAAEQIRDRLAGYRSQAENL